MLVVGVIVGIAYVILLVAEATTLANQSAAFVPLLLILGMIGAFSIGVLLATEYGQLRLLELEMAGAISAHDNPEDLPTPNSVVGVVLKEYVRASVEFRRSARCHTYAAGPLVWGALAALASAVFWGLGFATATTWPTYLALILVLPALVLLSGGVTILGTGVGRENSVSGFELLSPQRWRRYGNRPAAIQTMLRECPWLEEFARAQDVRLPAAAERPVARPVPNA